MRPRKGPDRTHSSKREHILVTERRRGQGKGLTEILQRQHRSNLLHDATICRGFFFFFFLLQRQRRSNLPHLATMCPQHCSNLLHRATTGLLRMCASRRALDMIRWLWRDVCQKRPTAVSKETYCSVKIDLLPRGERWTWSTSCRPPLPAAWFRV